jgi:hypothetical protein
MLTLSEFSSLAADIEELITDGDSKSAFLYNLHELMLSYTDLSSEDEEYLKELDEQLFFKLTAE